MKRFLSRLLRAESIKAFALAFAVSFSAPVFVGVAYAQETETVSDEGTIVSDAGAEGRVIEEVVVDGNVRTETSTVRAYMLLNEGDGYSAEAADQTLKLLFQTGYFSDIVIRIRANTLSVRVVENPMINRVIFRGNRAVKDDDLEPEVELRARMFFTRAQVQADVQRILEIYRRKGRFSAQVNPQIVELPQNRVDLVFDINDGPETGVRRINFLGNDVYSDRRLRGVIATEETKWWRIFSANDNYDPDRLTFDREQLRRFYLSKGYADFRVVNAVAELTPDRRDFFITISVEEGEQYTVGNVEVNSELERLDEDVMRRLVPIQEGETYNADFIERSIDNLTFFAGAAGYAFVDISPRVRRNRDEHTVDLSFEVNEGPRVYIERINIVGNTRTLDRVIRREFRLAEGDAFNRVLVERSRSRVRGLGFFQSVEVTEEPGTLPDRTVLNVQVEEQPTGEISFGLGFSSTDSYVFDLSVTERNLLGRGQFLRFAIQFSARTRQVDIRFTEPYFLGRNLAAGFDLFQTRNDFVESNFTTETTGAGIRLGFPISERNRINLNYTVRRELIEPDDGYCNVARWIVDEDDDGVDDRGFTPLPSVCAFGDTNWLSLAGYTFTSDHRDDFIEPRSGYFLSISQQLAGLGGDIHYLRSEVDARTYYAPFDRGIFNDVVFSLRGSGGYIFDWADDNGLRSNDRFYKGGATFRGFEPAGIGPRSIINNDALGGRMYAIGTAEIGFPLPTPEALGLDAAIFADFGTVGLLTDSDIGGFNVRQFVDDDLSMRASVGVSVFWDSPFGPVRLDFAHVLSREDYDKTEAFRFSGGTRF